MNTTNFEPTFFPLVDACRAHKISKTRAFHLAKTGELETVLLGSRRYVVLDSLRSLPQRLARRKKNGVAI